MADGRLTALQAALAGIGGGVTSAQKYGETRRLEAERKRMFDEERARQARLDERQRELDRISMLDKGYMTPEAQGAAKRTGGAAVLRAALTGARDQAAIDQGLSAAAPQQTTTFGGQQYTRETPFAKAAREASRALYEEQEKKKRERADQQAERVRGRLEKQYGDEQRVQSLMATGEYTEPQARAEVFGGSEAYKPLTRFQREDVALRRRQLGIAEQRLKRAGEEAAGDASEVDNYYDDIKNTLQDFMPKPAGVDKEGKPKFEEPKEKFQAKGLFTALAASDWTRWAASEEGQRYVELVSSISNAYAVAKEGRGASNADKQAYLNEVLIKPGQFGNLKLMNDKWNRLQQRIEFLRNKEKQGLGNRQAAGTAGKRGSALDELEDEGI